MNYDKFHEIFCDTLSSKIPYKKDLVDFISLQLHMEKRAVYRRLDGDHQFRINEVLDICSLMDISLDNISLSKTSEYQPPSVAYYPFGRMTQKEYDSLNYWMSKYKSAINQKGSYVLISSNILPDIFCFKYDNLIRFNKLKWDYYMGEHSCANHMDDEPVLQPAHLSALKDYVKTIFDFPKLLIVWDYNIIPSIIKDIDYFTQIGYLTNEHRGRLKEELSLLLNHIDDLCKEFALPGFEDNFTFAVSSTCLPKTHSIIKGDDFRISVDSAFYTTYLHVSDPRIVEMVEHIIMAILKSSVIISHSNESERCKFITNQKLLVDNI